MKGIFLFNQKDDDDNNKAKSTANKSYIEKTSNNKKNCSIINGFE